MSECQDFQFKDTDKIKHIACGEHLKVLWVNPNCSDQAYLTRLRWCTKCKELIKIGINQKRVDVQ